MQRMRLLLAGALVAALAVAACGGGNGNPAGPSAASGSTGATIAGTLNGMQSLSGVSAGSTGATDSGAPSGVTVSIVGTNLSASVDTSGKFHVEGVQPGSARLRFTHGSTSATGVLPNVNRDELVRVQVTLNGTTAVIVEEERATGKVSLCHSTGTGQYHSIEVSVAAEPAHRAHGDGMVGEPVPADPTKVFGTNCQPTGASVRIEKSTNGYDADDAPGPTIEVGRPVTWEYVVTNTGTVPLTGIVVTDDRGVAVNCGGQTSLDPAQSMTCTGSGVAAAGQYRNVGTVRADWTGGSVEDSDASHYHGVVPDAEDEGEQKVNLCHRTGAGFYVFISVSVSAEPAHRAHGDAKPGEAVPGSPGKVFSASCSVQ
jgi:hypothetical protein